MILKNIKMFESIYIPIRLGFITGEILSEGFKVDTGADITIISENILQNKCKLLLSKYRDKHYNPKGINLNSASGDKIAGYYVPLYEFFITHRGFKNLNKPIFVNTGIANEKLLGRDLLDYYITIRNPEETIYEIKSFKSYEPFEVEVMDLNDKRKYINQSKSIENDLNSKNIEFESRDLAIRSNTLAGDIFYGFNNRDELIKIVIELIAPAIFSKLTAEEKEREIKNVFLNNQEFFINKFLRLNLITSEEVKSLKALK